LQGILKG
jgi:hypothetical protein